jgi:hypothetical protein
VAEAEARTLALQLAGAIKRFDDGVAKSCSHRSARLWRNCPPSTR